MTSFLSNLVDDLRGFAESILEAGLAPTTTLELEDVRAPSMRALLALIAELCALVPALLDEIEESEASDRVQLRLSHSPLRAQLSLHPADYQRTQAGLVPVRWLQRIPVCAPDTPSLAWLAHLIAVQDELLAKLRERVTKQIQEARLARRGTSRWAHADERELSGIEEELAAGWLSLRRAANSVRRAAGGRLRASARLPTSFPRSPAWSRLRRLSRELVEPARALPRQLEGMLARHETADVPYLYQRWCGVQMLRCFEELDWNVVGDAVGPLLLGGRIRLQRGAQRIDLWVEARISTDTEHPSGFRCTGRGEVSPDFLLVVKGPSRHDAFVLDATMTADREVILQKGKYLNLLRASRPGWAAGLEVYARPLRSWAAAPIQGGLSRQFDQDASWGVLPMNPARFHPAPLRAWVLDVDRYVRAWHDVEDDPRFEPLWR